MNGTQQRFDMNVRPITNPQPPPGIMGGILVDSSGRRKIKEKQGEALLEMVWQPIYSQKTKAIAANESLSYFRGISSSGDLLLSNVTTDSVLSQPETLDIFGATLLVEQGIDRDDLTTFYNNTVMTFTMGIKNYLEIPILKIPSGGGFAGFASTTENATTIFQATNCLPSANSYYPMVASGYPLHLNSQQKFQYNTITTAPGDFSNSFVIWAFLDGILGRQIQ